MPRIFPASSGEAASLSLTVNRDDLVQIFQYNGSAIVAMAGENCVAIGSDLRFGVQMQTMATDHQKLMQACPSALRPDAS